MNPIWQPVKTNRQLKKNNMKTKIHSSLAAIFCLLVGGATPAFAQGTAFSYEGRLNTNGSPAQGVYDFRYAIYDGVTNGTQIGGTLTNSATGITNGLFTATLDFGPGIFTGPARWLEIGVRTNGGVFTNMTPRTALLAAPYAIMAGNAGNLGGQPSSAFAPVSGSSTYVAKAGDTMTGSLNLSTVAILGFGSQTRQMLSLYDFGIYHYGIGVQNLTLYQRAAVGGGGFAWYSGGVHNDGQNNAGGGTTLMLLDGSGNLTATGAGSFNGSANDGVYGASGGGNGVHGVTSAITQAGVAGVNTGGGYGVAGFSDATNGTGVYGRGQGGPGVSGTSTSNDGVYGSSGSGNGVHGVTSAIGQAGVAGVNAVGGYGVAGFSDEATGTGVYGRGNAWAGYFQGNVNVTGSLNVGGNFVTVNGAGGEKAYLGGDGLGGDIQIGSQNPAITAVACYNTANNAYMHINCSSITIFGGADLAEPFQITAAENEISQGAVVVIDEENPGHLKLSDQPYDTRVAGVVSGAGGINPGIQMQQKGLLEGGKNISLAGRVYVLADASNGAIKPGDLLTTSNTPGHAMKVTNHNQAHGAILGKAMSSLKLGKGMVLVLVTLQ